MTLEPFVGCLGEPATLAAGAMFIGMAFGATLPVASFRDPTSRSFHA